MADVQEAVTSVTHDPKRLALVVGAGIGIGLLWRHFSKGKAVAGGTSEALTNPYDAMQGAGNLGAFGSNIGGEPTTNDGTADRRDVVNSGITLPVAQWVITGTDGSKYLTDGLNITPYPGMAVAPAPAPPTPDPQIGVLQSAIAALTSRLNAAPVPAPAPTPAPAPAPAQAPPTPQAPAPAPAQAAYTIKSGDTLWNLVQKQYGLSGNALINKINEVAAANNLRWNSAHTMVSPFNVGQQIRL